MGGKTNKSETSEGKKSVNKASGLLAKAGIAQESKSTSTAKSSNTKKTEKTAGSKAVSSAKSVSKPTTKTAGSAKSASATKTIATKATAETKSASSAKSAATTVKSATTTAKSAAVSKTSKPTAPKAKTSAKKGIYDEDSIQHLEGLEHIRLRPGMYIGSLGDGTNENDGIYILLKEGIDNAVDEFSQGFGNRIDIDIKDNRVRIRDYGRGIPLGKLIDCVSKTNTGAKYNDSVFKQAIGMNGVGIKATNALSSYFKAASIREGKMAVVEYERGELKTSKTGNAKDGVKNGTYLEFVPDEELFGKYEFNMDMVEKRLWNYAYLNPGLNIVCNGKQYVSKNGLIDLLNNEMDGKPLYPLCENKQDNIQFVFTHTSELDKVVYSYVNGQSTEDGGTHVTSFLDGFAKGVNDFFKKDYDIKDICGGLVVALKISIDNPMFTSQTKNKLGNVEIRAPIIKDTQIAVDDWLRHNPSVAATIEEKILKNQKAHAEINGVKKEAREAAKKISLKIPKLKDCRYHLQDGLLGADSMIFITEGDSATGSMVGSRDVQTQAIFSLRGKPENMFGRKQKDIYKNEELYNLMMALGIQEDVDDLRYGKIIIATDADNDGFHIRNLVLTFFLLFFEELVLTGRVYILETPLFRVRNKSTTVYCYDEATRDAEIKRLGSSAEVTRFKGLGEINPTEFGQFIHERKEGDTEDVGMHLTPVSIQTLKNVPKVLQFYMGKNTPERRDFIVHHLASEIDA